MRQVFVYKLCLHRNNFFLKSTILNPIVIIFFFLYLRHIKYKIHVMLFFYILVEFQQISSPSSRPISPWSTSSSSAGIFLFNYYIYSLIDFI